MAPTEDAVRQALRGVMDPELHHNLIELGLVREIEIENGTVYIEIQLTSPRCPFVDDIVASIKRAVKAVAGVQAVEVEWSCQGGP